MDNLVNNFIHTKTPQANFKCKRREARKLKVYKKLQFSPEQVHCGKQKSTKKMVKK